MTGQVQVSAGEVYEHGYHVAWCPKYRRLVPAGRVAARCKGLIRAKASKRSWSIVALEVMPDHVHLFMKAHRPDSPSPIASQFKGFTSRRLRAEFPRSRSRLLTLWSRSYFAATVGAASAETLRRYSGTQIERRRREGRAQ